MKRVCLHVRRSETGYMSFVNANERFFDRGVSPDEALGTLVRELFLSGEFDEPVQLELNSYTESIVE